MESPNTGRRIVRRLTYGTAAAALVGFAFAGTASAVPFSSQSNALAVTVQPSGGVTTDSSMRVANNDGSMATVTDANSPALSVLGVQSVLENANLVQIAQANNDGTAAACAGATPGLVDTASLTACAPAAREGLLTITLQGDVRIQSRGIQQTCTASSGVAAPSSAASLAGAIVTDGTTVFTIPSSPDPNTDLLPMLPTGLREQLGLFTHIIVNEQSSDPGVIHGTALDAVSNGGNKIQIGSVSCGPVADTAASPMVAKAAAPVALAAGGVAVVGLLMYRRRRASDPAGS